MSATAAAGAVEAIYPPAPWRLQGPFAVIVMPVPLPSAAASLPGGLSAVPVAPGRSLGGLVLARYEGDSTMYYSELIVFSALARGHGRLGFWVSHIYVDDERSVAGGRAIWGLPKEMAEFAWNAGGHVAVSQGSRPLVEARLPARGRRTALPLAAAAWGGRAGDLRLAAGVGRMRGAPARPRVHIPAESPFAAVALGTPLGGVAGIADLPFPPPRRFPDRRR